MRARPNQKILRDARTEFEKLLTKQTQEPEWQEFFTLHPYVLSLSLPLRLEPRDIVPLARPGHSEPDFIFYPKRLKPPPYCGLIEIKRPDSKIVSRVRSNVAILSRDAETAIAQAESYSVTVRSTVMKPDNILFLGNEQYIFVIMGLISEIKAKIDKSLLQQLIQNRLPRNLQILPYDFLLKRFEQEILPTMHILVPTFDDQAAKPVDTNKAVMMPVDELELSVHSFNLLRNAKIRSIADLISNTESEMLELKNFGRKSLTEIKEVLHRMDLRFGMSVDTKYLKRSHKNNAYENTNSDWPMLCYTKSFIRRHPSISV